MCRFLMVKSNFDFQPGELALAFSEMCRKSRSLEGDWQGDGWGLSYLSDDGNWVLKKSIKPVWEEKATFKSLAAGRFFLFHARSSSFPEQRNCLDYNQPFCSGPYSFVFNGFIKGICLPFPVKGEIGSQKIWNMLQSYLKSEPPEEALGRLKGTIIKHSRGVQALNVGLADKQNIYALCYYSSHPEYYALWSFESPSLKLISSEPLPIYDFKPLASGAILNL